MLQNLCLSDGAGGVVVGSQHRLCAPVLSAHGPTDGATRTPALAFTRGPCIPTPPSSLSKNSAEAALLGLGAHGQGTS